MSTDDDDDDPSRTMECLQWLHTNLVLSPGMPLSSEQLRQLADAVGVDDVRLPVLHLCHAPLFLPSTWHRSPSVPLCRPLHTQRWW